MYGTFNRYSCYKHIFQFGNKQDPTGVATCFRNDRRSDSSPMQQQLIILGCNERYITYLRLNKLMTVHSMVRERGKRVYITVINDLVTDQRVHRITATLAEEGAEPFLIGRRLRNSVHPPDLPWKCRRFRMLFTGGPFFYFFFNIRIFFFLLFASRPHMILANDLDTLSSAFLVSRLRKVPLLYDSHEYFTELPELVDRKHIRAVWEKIERLILPNVKFAMTVCSSIAEEYKRKYGISFEVVRNMPVSAVPVISDTWKERFPGKRIVLYQGAVNKGRGLEMVIKSMPFLDDVQFIIAGSGDIDREIDKLIKETKTSDRVLMTGRLRPEELFQLTCQADLGLSVEEDLGLNYRFALPNKLFDYIRANVPVLCSDLPEMAAIVKGYDIGMVSGEREPAVFAIKVMQALEDPDQIYRWKENLKRAAAELNWENESLTLRKLYHQVCEK